MNSAGDCTRWRRADYILPPENVPVHVWGTKLSEGDFPFEAQLCSHCKLWIASESRWGDEHDALVKMVGEVTHWLQWWPIPISEGSE